MMRSAVSALALTFVLASCGGPKAADTPAAPAAPEITAEQKAETSKALNEWFDAKYEEQLQFSPIGLSFLGRKDKNDQIDCFTLECQDEQVAWMRAAADEMVAKFPYEQLSDEDKISFDVWKYQSDQGIAGKAFRNNGYVFDQMNGAQSFLPTFLINFHNVEEADDAKAYVKRITAGARALREGIEIAKVNAAQGVHAPAFAYNGVIDQSKKIITGAPFDDGPDSALFADFKADMAKLVEGDKLTADEAAALTDQAKAAMTGDFLSAYNELIAFAEGDLVNSPDSTKAVGASTQPNGIAYYDYLLSTQTTTSLTSNEIHEIGLAEVTRIRAEMEVIKEKFGFEGTLEEFFIMMRTSKDDERFYYPNTDAGRLAYIEDATAAIDKIKSKLPDYFGILPKADLIVKRVEPFREQDGAAQHYFTGTPDGSRPGIYYAHLSDMTAMPKSEVEVIAYHEGLPGHHMQLSIAQELTGVPQFRTQLGFTAYVEGWALYSEKLATEFPGTYEDDISNFGRLGSEIWRAIRLVVDTGLHAKGWTEEEAVEYFLSNGPTTDAQAKSEVQRYIVMPGQATSYKIGMIKFQEVRAKAEAELGEKFDIKAFHDTVLGGGALPLDILERRVDQWIEEVKAS